jgi:hypothetical protein
MGWWPRFNRWVERHWLVSSALPGLAFAITTALLLNEPNWAVVLVGGCLYSAVFAVIMWRRVGQRR